MRKMAQTVTASIVCIAVIMLITACEEERNVPSTKMSKLVANENRQLKEQLEQCNPKIEKQRRLFVKCLQEKKVLIKQTSKNIKEQVDSVLIVVMEENAKLRQENESLKTQAAELRKELEEAKKPNP